MEEWDSGSVEESRQVEELNRVNQRQVKKKKKKTENSQTYTFKCNLICL